MLTQIRDILATIEFGEGKTNLAQVIGNIEIKNDKITLIFELSKDQLRVFEAIKSKAEQILKSKFPDHSVFCIATSHNPNHSLNSNIKHIIAIASGKGGVGKSTIAVNLAVALTKESLKVGLLDADIYGPSLPRMLGITEKPIVDDNKKLIPIQRYGVSAMSIGLLLEEEKPLIWRGPMAQGALMQLLRDVAWGTLDVLLIDMPPGTGDIQLSLTQQASLSGAIIVSTPQDIALIDARKGLNMFRRLGVPILGIIENMSSFSCPHCSTTTDIFGHGGAYEEAQRLHAPFLGSLPLTLETRLACDEGMPVNVKAPQSPISKAFQEMAQKINASLGGKNLIR